MRRNLIKNSDFPNASDQQAELLFLQLSRQCWESCKLPQPLKLHIFGDLPLKTAHFVLQRQEQMLRNYGTTANCSEDLQNKMVLGERKKKPRQKKTSFRQHIVPRSGRRKLSATEDLTLYPLFFMTQTYWEVCSESSNTERIMLSLAAITGQQ